MTILAELVVAASKYTDASGKEKTRWQRIGHLHSTKDGSRQYITLDPLINLAAVPRKDGDDRVYVNMFEPKGEKGEGGGAPTPKPQPKAGAFDEMNDDIPF